MRNFRMVLILVAACAALLAGCAQTEPPAPSALIQSPVISPTPPEEIQTANALPPQSGQQPENLSLMTPTQTQKSQDKWFFISPDGEWTVHVEALFPVAADGRTITGDQYTVRLNVFRKDDSLRWQILEESRPFGLGYTLPGQFHWSRDGSALYFSEHGIADGSLTVIGFDCGLFRVALDSGSMSALSRECGILRAAPDDSGFALIQDGRLLVRNNRTNSEREFAYTDLLGMAGEQDWQAGGLVWSADASRLLFTLIRNISLPDETRTSFVLVDLNSGQARFVMDPIAGQHLSSEWREDGKVVVLDAFQLVYLLDVDQQTLLPAN